MPDLTTPDGLKWHYEAAGDGPPLLFIHGWAGHGRVWLQQVQYFSQSYRVLTVDLPGHGQSAWQKRNLKQIAEDLAFILDQLHIATLIVVGSSLGGLVALALAGRYPKKVKQLCLVGALPKFSKSKDYPFGLDVPRMHRLRSQVEREFPEILEVFHRSLFTNEEREDERFKWLQQFRKTDILPQPTALREYLRVLETEDLREALPQLLMPVKLVTGAADYICSPAALKSFSAEIPRAEVDIFEGCGHFPFITRAAQFNSRLQSFLRSHDEFFPA